MLVECMSLLHVKVISTGKKNARVYLLAMPKSPIEDIRIWHQGMTLAKHVYECTKNFPPEERYGLTAQMRRSALSIPSNIAEGSQRGTNKDFAHFLTIARGSWAELKTQIILARDLGYIPSENAEEIIQLIDSLARQLGSLHAVLASRV